MDYFISKMVASAGSVLGRARDRSRSQRQEEDANAEDDQSKSTDSRPSTTFGHHNYHGRGRDQVPPPGIGRAALLLCIDALKSTTSFIYDGFQITDTEFEIGDDSLVTTDTIHPAEEPDENLSDESGRQTPHVADGITPMEEPTSTSLGQMTPDVFPSSLKDRVPSPPPAYSEHSFTLHSLTPVYVDSASDKSNISSPSSITGGVSLAVTIEEHGDDDNSGDISELPLLEVSEDGNPIPTEITSLAKHSDSADRIESPVHPDDMFTSPRTFSQGLSIDRLPVSMYSIGYQADSEGDSSSDSGSSSADQDSVKPKLTGSFSESSEADDLARSFDLLKVSGSPLAQYCSNEGRAQMKPEYDTQSSPHRSQASTSSKMRYRQADEGLVGPNEVLFKGRGSQTRLFQDEAIRQTEQMTMLARTVAHETGLEEGPPHAEAFHCSPEVREQVAEYVRYQEFLGEPMLQVDNAILEHSMLDQRSPPKDYFNLDHTRHGGRPLYSTPQRRAFRASSGDGSMARLDPAKLLWRQDSLSRSEVLRSRTNTMDREQSQGIAKAKVDRIITCVCPNCQSPPIGDGLRRNYCMSCGMAVEWPMYIPLPGSSTTSYYGSPARPPSTPAQLPSHRSTPARDPHSPSRRMSPSKIPLSPRMLADMLAKEAGRRESFCVNTDDEQIWANGLTLGDMVDAAVTRKRRGRHSAAPH